MFALNAALLIALTAPFLVSATLTLPTTLLYTSTPTLFFENLAVRPDGTLLLTSVQIPKLFSLDPGAANVSATFTAAAPAFPNANGLLGIAETQPDVYAVVASMLNFTTQRALPGSVAIWLVDLRGGAASAELRPSPAAVIANSTLVNGLACVPGAPGVVLAADSAAGAVYAVDTDSGAVDLVLHDPALSGGAPPALGINGLHVRDSFLYFTNTALGTFSRVPLDVRPSGAVAATGPVEVVGTVNATAGQLLDDFAFDDAGRAWVATHPGSLTLFTPLSDGTWTQDSVLGSPAPLEVPTSAKFGKGRATEKILFVTSEVGQILQVDTSGVDSG